MSSKQDRAAERQQTQTPKPELVVASVIPIDIVEDVDPRVRAEAEAVPVAAKPWDNIELDADDKAAVEADEAAYEQARLKQLGVLPSAIPQNVGITVEQMMAFGKVIGDAVAAGNAKHLRPKVTFGQYDPKTEYHPDKRLAKHLTRACFQNGALMMEGTLFDEEIDLLNAITHSGRYINRLVEVVLKPNGAEDEVYLVYHNKTIDQRMDHKSHYSSLRQMLRLIVTAQTQERADDEANRSTRAARGRR